MRKISALDPKRLIVTDPPTSLTIAAAYELRKIDLLWNNTPPIVVVPYQPLGLLILDGHCRAYVLAFCNRPIRARALTHNSDRDALLELEHSRKIPPFPHREYLMEKINLSQLRLQAFQQAKSYGFLTVQGLLDMDIDSIKPVSLPPVSEAVASHTHKHERSRSETIECLVLYDRERGHFLPIAPAKLKEAKGSGYECVKVTDLVKVQEGIAWAKEYWDRLDETVHKLAVV